MKNFLYLIIFLITINISALTKNKVYDSYSLETVYSTLIRYIIIDENYKIVKKDIEGAYIIFDSKEVKGKIELIKRGKNSVEMILNFDGAHYKLVLFMKKFNKKLEKEQDFKEKK